MFQCPSYLKIGLFAAAIALLGAGAGYLHHRVYENGFEAGVKSQQDADKKVEKHNETVHDVTKQAISGIDVAASAAASSEKAHTTVVVKTVEKIVHDHPDFGAVRRPAELERLRLEQIARLRALAAPGAQPAAGSTAPESPDSG